MLQLPTPTAFDPSWTSVTEQPPEPSETQTFPAGQTVPLAGVTDTWTSSVVPSAVDVCVVPVIAVVVLTVVAANAVPGDSRTDPSRPPISITAAMPAVRRQLKCVILCTCRPSHPWT